MIQVFHTILISTKLDKTDTTSLFLFVLMLSGSFTYEIIFNFQFQRMSAKVFSNVTIPNIKF